MKHISLLAVFAVATLGAAAVATVTEANDQDAHATTPAEVTTEAAAETAVAPAAEAAEAETAPVDHNAAEIMTVTETVHLPTISADDLQKLIAEDDELVIVDSRSMAEYAQGHIPNAVLLTASEATPERLAALAPNKEAHIVFYCGSITCPASAKTAYKAAEAGYKNISKYAEGFADWKGKNLPVVSN